MFPTPNIPDDWSAEQALAIYEFLDALRERVWDRYQDPIIEHLQADRQTQEKDDAQLELAFYPFNDEIPF